MPGCGICLERTCPRRNLAYEQFQSMWTARSWTRHLRARRDSILTTTRGNQVRCSSFWMTAWKDRGGHLGIRGPWQHFTHRRSWLGGIAVQSRAKIGSMATLIVGRNTRKSIQEVGHRVEVPQISSCRPTVRSTRCEAAVNAAVGFLPPDDPRIVGTINAIESGCCRRMVLRYSTRGSGRAPGRGGCLLPCSFWLADAMILSGRRDEALALC